MPKPATQLGLIAIASATIYALAFVWHYSLLEWWQQPLLDIAEISHRDTFAGAAYVLAFVALFLLYALACRIAQRDASAAMWRVAIAGIVAFNAILLWLYPVDAADIFDNIVHGRMTALYGANPFYQTASQFPNDPLYKYTAWEFYPSAYGAGWELMAAAIARAADDDVITNVLAFKLISVAAYAATGALIAITLRRVAPERALYGTLLFAWNPLLLYVTAGNGHNDAVMLLFIALGFYFLAREQFTLAALGLTAGALVKFIPALILPLVIVATLKRQHDWGSRARFLLSTFAACGLLMVVAYAPFWRGGDVLGLARRSDLLTTSLATLIQITLAPSFGETASGWIATRIVIVLLGAWIIRQMRVVWQRSADFSTVVRASASVLIFYLVVACLWFQPWYVVWLLPLVALATDEMLMRGVLFFSFWVTMKMPLFEFVMQVSPSNIPPRATREWQITLGTMGPVWLFLTWAWLRLKRQTQ